MMVAGTPRVLCEVLRVLIEVLRVLIEVLGVLIEVPPSTYRSTPELLIEVLPSTNRSTPEYLSKYSRVLIEVLPSTYRSTPEYLSKYSRVLIEVLPSTYRSNSRVLIEVLPSTYRSTPSTYRSTPEYLSKYSRVPIEVPPGTPGYFTRCQTFDLRGGKLNTIRPNPRPGAIYALEQDPALSTFAGPSPGDDRKPKVRPLGSTEGAAPWLQPHALSPSPMAGLLSVDGDSRGLQRLIRPHAFVAMEGSVFHVPVAPVPR